MARSEPRHEAITGTYRFFGSLRLLLAVMVLGQHVHWLAPRSVGREIESFFTGDIGVLTFFVLSGRGAGLNGKQKKVMVRTYLETAIFR